MKQINAEMLKLYEAFEKGELTMVGNLEATPINPNERFEEWLLIATTLLKTRNRYQNNADILKCIQRECTRHFLRHADWYRNQECVDLFTEKIQFDSKRFWEIYGSVDYGLYSINNTCGPMYTLDQFFNDAPEKIKREVFRRGPFGFVKVFESPLTDYSKLFTKDYIYKKLFEEIKSVNINNEILLSIKDSLNEVKSTDMDVIQWKHQILSYIEKVEQEQGYVSQSNTHTTFLTAKEVVILGNAIAYVLLKNDNIDRSRLSKFLEKVSGYSYNTLYSAAKILGKEDYGFNGGYDNVISRLYEIVDLLPRKSDQAKKELPFHTMREHIKTKLRKKKSSKMNEKADLPIEK